MITILNKEKLYKNIEIIIKRSEHCNKRALKFNVYNAILSMMKNDKVLDSLILDEDKNYVEIDIMYSYINKRYKLILFRKLLGKSVTLLEIEFNDTGINLGKEYSIIYFATMRDDFQNPRFYLFRNSISLIPDANETRKKYNRIQNILNKFKCNVPIHETINYLVTDRKSKDSKTDAYTFFNGVLSNNIYSDFDEEYFSKILTLNANDSRIETIWIYYKKLLKEIGFYKKECISIFDNHLGEIKKHLNNIEIEPLFDFKYGCINLMFETGLEYPNHNVFIKIKNNEEIENLLNKELYKYSGEYNIDYIKIEGVFLKNYIENKEEVIQLMKLFDY